MHLPLLQLRAQLRVVGMAPGMVERAQRSPPPALAKVGLPVVRGCPAARAPSPWGFAGSRGGISSLHTFPKGSAARLPCSGTKTFPREPHLLRGRGAAVPESENCSWPGAVGSASSSFVLRLPCPVPAAANPQLIPLLWKGAQHPYPSPPGSGGLPPSSQRGLNETPRDPKAEPRAQQRSGVCPAVSGSGAVPRIR